MTTARRWITRDGDMLDAIAWRVYGSEQAVHALLAANPHVVRHPPRLPAGLALTLPPVSAAPRPVHSVRLWSAGPR